MFFHFKNPRHIIALIFAASVIICIIVLFFLFTSLGNKVMIQYEHIGKRITAVENEKSNPDGRNPAGLDLSKNVGNGNPEKRHGETKTSNEKNGKGGKDAGLDDVKNTSDPNAGAKDALSGETVESSGQTGIKDMGESPSFDYQKDFLNLYVKRALKEEEKDGKTAYLTFDDGPSECTSKILDILKQYDVKATFFVVGKTDEQSKSLLKRISAEGHSVGIHSYSHNYMEIYGSVKDFLSDMDKCYNFIYEQTGKKPDIIRFAGGSINTYNSAVFEQIAAEVLRRGFTYFDWNVSTGDAGVKNISSSEIVNNVLKGINGKNRVIILAHDGKKKDTTIEALPQIITKLKARGYVFDRLTNAVKPIVFTYPNP